MKNSTLLRLNIREVLAQYCFHDDASIDGDACETCESLEDDLYAAVATWRMHAYGTSKGKI
jgi:hypothetical protein